MTTARYSLPLLQVGQAQKELTHNECIQSLENCVQPVVEGEPSNVPPANPEIGRQYLVGEAASGDFAEHSGEIATWTDAGWLFTLPRDRFSVVDRQSGLSWSFEDEAWRSGLVRAAEVQIGGQKVVGRRQPAVATPSGGNVIDQEARDTIGALLSAMRQHGLISS